MMRVFLLQQMLNLMQLILSFDDFTSELIAQKVISRLLVDCFFCF
jgi:hypothetical protein